MDHILNIPLDASKYKYESKAVPFLGMVLHGYVNYAGSVINEAGDSSAQLLKSIENGALLYYMLVYQNTNLLKEDKEFSKYYSVRFDIWFNTVVEQYNALNGAIGDLQLYNIVDHDFLIGERVPLDYENTATINNVDRLIKMDLENQYSALVASARKELRIRQTAQDLIRAGYTNEAALLARMVYVLGAKLSDEEKLIVAECLDSYENGIPFEEHYGKTVSVALDRAKIEAKITEITEVPLTEDQKQILDEFVLQYCVAADVILTIDSLSDSVQKKNNKTDSHAQMDKDVYEATDYTDASGRIVLVTYAKGDSTVHFVLNYNTYAVNVRLQGVNGNEPFEVPAYGFQRINGTELAN